MVRVRRIELRPQAWEAHVLPLNYTRIWWSLWRNTLPDLPVNQAKDVFFPSAAEADSRAKPIGPRFSGWNGRSRAGFFWRGHDILAEDWHVVVIESKRETIASGSGRSTIRLPKRFAETATGTSAHLVQVLRPASFGGFPKADQNRSVNLGALADADSRMFRIESLNLKPIIIMKYLDDSASGQE